MDPTPAPAPPLEENSLSETLLEIAAKHGNKASVGIVAAYAAHLTEEGREELIRAIHGGGPAITPTTFHIYRDDSIPAFGGWAAGSLKDGEPTILLNVAACLSPCVTGDGSTVEMSLEDRKWLVLTTLMHEFGHAMQEFLDIEFEEERMEGIVEEYERRLRGFPAPPTP